MFLHSKLLSYVINIAQICNNVNPCQCGYLGHPTKRCSCTPFAIAKYRKRVSGPILDRIDIHIDVPPVKEDKLLTYHPSETTHEIKKRITAARKRQEQRFHSSKMNAEMSTADIRTLCALSDQATALLKTAVTRLSLSARSYFKIIKIAQTIADLAQADQIKGMHIAEALQYRPKDD
jgi:magnesium chelatase family protein